MISNLIIAVSGKMQHGKDTVGEYLIAKYGFRRLSFADKLKKICMSYDNSTPEKCNFWSKKVARELLEDESRAEEVEQLMQQTCPGIWHKLTYEECYEIKTTYSRRVLQEIGGACDTGMRALSPGCWVRYALKTCTVGRWVITDLRFKDEAYAVEASENSQIWRVVRSVLTVMGSDHESETSMDDYPFEVIINNDGTIDELHTKVDRIIRAILRGSRPFAIGEEVY